MRIVPVLVAMFVILGGMSYGEERKRETSAMDNFFDRLVTNGDGNVTLDDPNSMKERL